MASLFRNYTVVVQESLSPYTPNNDLELFLYEGHVELKTNPSSGEVDVMTYGTTVQAPRVYDQSGSPAQGVLADSVNRPGEYDFIELDLNYPTSASALGNALYSVVARPVGDSYFEHGKVIIDRTYISDPNTKQIVQQSLGASTSFADNMYYAGGTVAYEPAGTPSDRTDACFITLLNLPAIITDKYETVSLPPTDFTGATKRLTARFDVRYTLADSTNSAFWSGVPAYLMGTKWMLCLTDDQYCLGRWANFGSTGGETDIQLIKTAFIVSVNMGLDNVFIRSYSKAPKILSAGDNKELAGIHGFISTANEKIVGIGTWGTTSATPIYNLDVMGGLGGRITIGTTSKLAIIPTSSRMGFDTDDIYFGCSASALYGKIGNHTKFLFNASSADIYANDSESPYPGLRLLGGDGAYLYGSKYSYLSYTATELAAYIANSDTTPTSARKAIKILSSSSVFGYDLTGVNSAIGAGSSSVSIAMGGVYKLLAQTTGVTIGQDVTTYPKVVLNGGTVTSYGDTAGTYFRSGSAELTGAVDRSGAVSVFSATATRTAIGYNVTNADTTPDGACIIATSTGLNFYRANSGSVLTVTNSLSTVQGSVSFSGGGEISIANTVINGWKHEYRGLPNPTDFVIYPGYRTAGRLYLDHRTKESTIYTLGNVVGGSIGDVHGVIIKAGIYWYGTGADYHLFGTLLLKTSPDVSFISSVATSAAYYTIGVVTETVINDAIYDRYVFYLKSDGTLMLKTPPHDTTSIVHFSFETETF